jgi:hypothetical protein
VPAGVAAASGVGVACGLPGRPGRWAKDKDVTSNTIQTKANDRRNLCTAKTPLKWIVFKTNGKNYDLIPPDLSS